MDLPTVLKVEELDCKSCGACCKAHPSYRKGWVPIYTQGAAANNPEMTSEQKEEYLVEITPNRFAMKLTPDLRCAALSGEIGVCVSCDIYDNRPWICRKFEKGEDACHEARSQVGLGPFD